jgi:hypothetical protein
MGLANPSAPWHNAGFALCPTFVALLPLPRLLSIPSARSTTATSRGLRKAVILTEEHRHRLFTAIERGYRQLKDFYTAESARSERSAGAFLDLFEGTRCAFGLPFPRPLAWR